jgi:hypothetical protein
MDLGGYGDEYEVSSCQSTTSLASLTPHVITTDELEVFQFSCGNNKISYIQGSDNGMFDGIYKASGITGTGNLVIDAEKLNSTCNPGWDDRISVDTKSGNHSVSISPNPAQNHLKLEGLSRMQGEKIELYNMNNQSLYQETIDRNHLQINMSNISNGVYLLKIGNHVERIIVNH